MSEIRSAGAKYKVNEILNDWIWDFGSEIIIVNGTLLTRIDQILGKIY